MRYVKMIQSQTYGPLAVFQVENGDNGMDTEMATVSVSGLTMGADAQALQVGMENLNGFDAGQSLPPGESFAFPYQWLSNYWKSLVQKGPLQITIKGAGPGVSGVSNGTWVLLGGLALVAFALTK